MALTRTFLQNNYESNTDPTGVISGEKGSRLVDEVANKVYESLGGTNWKLIEDAGITLVERNVETLDKFKELKSLVVGETVQVTDRSDTHIKVTDIAVRNGALMTYQVGVKRDLYRCIDLSNLANGGNFLAGEVVMRMKFKLLGGNTASTTTYRAILFGTVPMGFRLTLPNATVGTFNANVKLDWIKDDKGNVIDNAYSEWNDHVKNDIYYEVQFSAINNFTANEIVVNTGADDGHQWILESFTISEDETVDFSNVVGNSAFGDKGSEYAWEDSLALSLDGPTIVQRADGNDLDIIIEDGAEYTRAEITPIAGVVTPQMFGAVSYSVNSTENPIDSTAAFQAAIDSHYDVYIPNGYYWIKGTLKFLKPKNFHGKKGMAYRTVGWGEAPGAILYKFNDVTIDPLDVPNNFMDVAANDVYITCGIDAINCNFDPTVVDYKRPAVVVHWANRNVIIDGKIDIIFQGGNISPYGWGYDISQLEGSTERDDIQTAGNGEMHKVDFVLSIASAHTVVNWTNEAPYNTQGLSTNTNTFRIRLRACKRAAYLRSNYASSCDWWVNFQCSGILSGEEAQMPMFDTASGGAGIWEFHVHDPGEVVQGFDTFANILALVPFDNDIWINTDSGIDDKGTAVAAYNGLQYDSGLSEWVATNPTHTNSVTMANNSSGNRIYDPNFYAVSSFDQRMRENYSLASNGIKPTNAPRAVITQPYKSFDKSFISKLDDILLSSLRKYTVTVNAFTNDGSFDFRRAYETSTLADPALGDGSSLVTLDSFPSGLFTYLSVNPPEIIYHDGWDEDNDFIELVIDGITGLGNLKRVILEHYSANKSKRIQMIGVSGTSWQGPIKDLTDNLDSRYLNQAEYLGGLPDIQKIIIRFIGCNQPIPVAGSIITQYSRLYAQTTEGNKDDFPFISSEGGKVYGTIEVDNMVVPDAGIKVLAGVNQSNSTHIPLLKALSKVASGTPEGEYNQQKNSLAIYDEVDSISGTSLVQATAESIPGDLSAYQLKVTSVAGGTSYKHIIMQPSIIPTAGTKLRVSFDLKNEVGTFARIGNWAGIVDGFSNYRTTYNTEWETYTFEFVSTGAALASRIYLEAGSDVGGKIVYLDNFRVESIYEPEFVTGKIKLNGSETLRYHEGAHTSQTAFVVDSYMRNGSATVAINTATKPTVSSFDSQAFTIVFREDKSKVWVPNANMWMVLECKDGKTVEWWFEGESSLTWAQLVALSGKKAGDKFVLTDSAYAGTIVLDSAKYFTWVDDADGTYYKIEIV